MMGKCKMLFLLFLMLAIPAIADLVPLENAKRVAQQWLELNDINGWRAENYPHITEFRQLTYNREIIGYHANIAPLGTIILMADDCLFPIKCYTSTTNFTFESPFEQALLKEMQSMTEFVKKHAKYAKRNQAWDALLYGQAKKERRAQTGPLMGMRWAQGVPYKNDCPADPVHGGTCVTGCVATATSQIMRFWLHPSQGTGSKSYTPVPATHAALYPRSADFNTTYQWDQMPLTNPPNPCAALSKLMYHVGIAVEMDYCSQGSGAYNSEVKTALQTYFKYKNTSQRILRSGYSDVDWYNLVKAQIDKGCPVEYAFRDPGPNAGHAVVVDGYELRTVPQYWFHFNFGWGGGATTWYDINDIQAGGYTWSANHEGIFGIVPDGDQWDPTDNNGNNATSLTPTTVEQTHGQHYLGTIFGDGADWFQVAMNAGQEYKFRSEIWGEIPKLPNLNDIKAELFSDSGGANLVASDDNGGSDQQFQLTYTAAESRTYYLKVTMSNGDNWRGNIIYSYTPHTVGVPTLTGPATGFALESLTFQGSASTCNQGHAVEYQFDWGDGNQSGWLADTRAASTAHNYNNSGAFTVKVHARCTNNNSIISNWQNKNVNITAHTVSDPNAPIGPSDGQTGENLGYSVDGGICNQGHTIQYQFDWGDGSQSGWMDSTRAASSSHTYSSANTFQVKVQARCKDYSTLYSNWSASKSVTITQGETPPSPSPSDDGGGGGGSCGAIGIEFIILWLIMAMTKYMRRKH